MRITGFCLALACLCAVSSDASAQLFQFNGCTDCNSYALGDCCGCIQVASRHPAGCSSQGCESSCRGISQCYASCESMMMGGGSGAMGSGAMGESGAIGESSVLDSGSGPLSTADVGSFGLLAGSTGVTAGSVSSAPGMIGDFFGGNYLMFIPSAGQSYGPSNIALAGADRRFKYAENNSPFPTDRLFFNYSHFHNALTTADGRSANLNRGTFGLEKTFFGGMTSLELRVPILSGLNNSQGIFSDSNNVSNEVGNLALATKLLLLQRGAFSVSTGLGIILPTAKDSYLTDGSGTAAFLIENQAVYLQPFLGLAYNPNDRLFVQSFAQMDFDTNGNTTTVLTRTNASGRIQDQSLLFLDTSIGYWLYRDPCRSGLLTGFAPMIELHYSTTMTGTDRVDMGQGDIVTNPDNRLDVLNLTGGLRFELRGRSYLTVAGVAPLRGASDQTFDAEFGLQFVRTY